MLSLVVSKHEQNIARTKYDTESDDLETSPIWFLERFDFDPPPGRVSDAICDDGRNDAQGIKLLFEINT